MPSIEKLRLLNEKSVAKEREEARKRKRRGAIISQLSRKQEDRRKILVGSWALRRAELSKDFEDMLLRELDTVWLYRDDDREIFGFELLSEEEKQKREQALADARAHKIRKAGATASRSDSSAESPAPRPDENQSQENRITEAA